MNSHQNTSTSKFVSIHLLLVLFFLSTQTSIVFAQNVIQSYPLEQFHYTNIGSDKGFIQSTIHDLFQDSKGNILSATPNGLFKYDGYEFERIVNDFADEYSLAYRYVSDVEQDPQGRLWVLNRKALNCQDSVSGGFVRYTSHLFNDIELKSITFDKRYEGQIWFCTTSNIGLMTLNYETQTIEDILYPLVSGDNNKFRGVRWVQQDNFGLTWVALGSKLLCFARDTQGAIYLVDEIHTEISQDVVCNEEGEVLVLAGRGIYKLALDSNKKIALQEELDLSEYRKDEKMDKICLSPEGDMWYIAWKKGLVRISEKADGYNTTYYPVFEDDDNLAACSLGAALIDRSGVLWFGTWNAGLFKINLQQKRFHSLDVEKSLYLHAQQSVNSITGDNRGNIWYSRNSGKLLHQRIDKDRVIEFNNVTKDYGLKGKHIALSYYDDALWALANGNLFRYEVTDKGKVKSRKKIALCDQLSSVASFYGDSDGVLWIGDFAKGRVYYVDTNKPLEEGMQTLCYENDTILDLNKGRISALKKDSDGNLWIGAIEAGIFQAKLKNGKVQDLTQVVFEDSMRGVQINGVFSIHEDDDRRMWLSSFGSGLAMIPMDKIDTPSEFKLYGQGDGLSDDVVYSIMQDKTGNLWMSTDRGISKMNTKMQTFQNYDTSDGIRSVNFRKWASWQDANGRIFFGGSKGVTLFDPKEIVINKYAPTVHINKMRANQESIPFTIADSLSFQPDQNNVEFAFTAIHMDAPQRIKYYYRLIGLDEQWKVAPANQRIVSYSYLDAGDYDFQVKAVTRDGVWSENIATVSFSIRQHWYLTWWAMSIYFALILSALFLWNAIQRYKRKIDQEMEYERMQKESVVMLNQAKLEFYTNISHEIKTPLTVISGVIDNVVSSGKNVIERGDFVVVNRNIKRMLQLVVQLLDFRRAVTGNLPFHPIHGNLSLFVRELVEPFEVYAEKRSMQLSCKVDDEQIMADFDPDKVNKILSNLVLNAFKYSKDGSDITVELKSGISDEIPESYRKNLKDDASSYLTMVVRDTGEGIKEENLENIFIRFFQSNSDMKLTDTNSGVGVGLSYVKILVELHGGFIFVKSKINEGSSFYVVLPEKQEEVFEIEQEQQEMILAQVVENAKETTIVEDLTNTEEEEEEDYNITLESERLNQSVEILIVEDNAEIRQFVREFLTPEYKVIEAENGRIGYEMALETVPDLIISDVMMPEMDGLEMIKRIKADQVTNHIPIILLTVNDHIENRIEGLKAGADSYITKPFNVEHLRVRIEKLLSLRNTLKDKYISLSGDQKVSDIDLNAADKAFLKKIEDIIEENLSDTEFSVAGIEPHIDCSRMQLYRKIKSLTGVTIVEFIRNYRLKRSIDMMHTTQLQIREILFDVGFNSPSYYSKCFKSRYGVTPKEFMAKIKRSTTTRMDD